MNSLIISFEKIWICKFYRFFLKFYQLKKILSDEKFVEITFEAFHVWLVPISFEEVFIRSMLNVIEIAQLLLQIVLNVLHTLAINSTPKE